MTYGDMMSLLLCFFVLLLSFSTISEKKYSQAVQSLKGALGVLPRNLAVVPVNLNQPPGQPRRRRSEELARRLRRKLQVANRAKDVKVELDEEGGLKINLPSRLLFDSARAELKVDALPLLDDISELLVELPNASIEVRGHTDNRPLRSAAVFDDNFHLSHARARAVMRYLDERRNVPEEQFRLIACGPLEPVATNDTEEGRQANRRVELYVRGDFPDDALEEMRQRIPEFEERVVEPVEPGEPEPE